MCIRQVSGGTNILCGLRKKRENLYSEKALFLALICLFYTSLFFMKQLCGRVACEDVHANFSFQFLKISKYV
jgi:hypothetical protein